MVAKVSFAMCLGNWISIIIPQEQGLKEVIPGDKRDFGIFALQKQPIGVVSDDLTVENGLEHIVSTRTEGDVSPEVVVPRILTLTRFP